MHLERLVHIRIRVLTLLAVTLLTMFGLSVFWEFSGEAAITRVMGWSYEATFENAERWRFILTTTAFSALSLLAPLLVLYRLMRKQRLAFNAMTRARADAERLARLDPLTGLPNRRVFLACLDEAVKTHAATLAVLLIDLDHFKSINDEAGHLVGDHVLCASARRIAAALPLDNAMVARLGGDEFAIAIWGNRGSQAIVQLGEHLGSLLSVPIIADPTTLPVSITATVGASMAQSADQSAIELMRRADRAMYRGKRAGRGSFNLYDDRLEQHAADYANARQRETHRRYDRLVQALDRGLVVPHFQPLVCLTSRMLIGFEVLARWHDAERGPIGPDEFIATAEQHDLIGRLTSQIIRQACEAAVQWPGGFTLAFNASGIQFRDGSLPEILRAAAVPSGFPLDRIQVEITEGVVIEDVATTLDAVHELEAMGVSIVLDDFGTGFSSLSRLHTLPFKKIKVDRSFVHVMLTDHGSRKIVDAVVGLGHSLGLTTIGEGVETEEQATMLTRLGCDIGQGWLFGRPMAASDVPTYLGSIGQTSAPGGVGAAVAAAATAVAATAIAATAATAAAMAHVATLDPTLDAVPDWRAPDVVAGVKLIARS
ncbi:bifunctional diguanylate cyclase/phosphodiesterase [Robbsia sp. Bb-Pol-6]|uniref:Bifunctional diguanylate cyclase/phosphodiesterase n=1 Tax=Robbsia betulipollinis TaxID=2981849 RepID=A0ABT3ZSE9_9BURK|nr:bifunctional diguanylate cyclase/phosphodiesterase [Robbsia betulipollinis]MCY0389474.1 bifunctional diguanylate cyclase/phosphodiesterase [Robbsia betulipollinis]